MSFLFRFEATDFDNTVFDMPRLSAIRGASLSYLYAPERVARALRGKLGEDQVEEIYAGASQGAWRLRAGQADAAAAAEAVREALGVNDLRGDKPTGAHAHMAYVTALVEGDDIAALHRAEAINALRMVQGDGFPLPAFDMASTAYDEYGDRARPVARGRKIGASPVSQCCFDRHEFGREQRQKFYGRMSGRANISADFTESFENLVRSPPPGLSESARGKLAVFYADGNKLGAHRDAAKARSGIDGLKAFSERFLANQRDLLGRIIDWLEAGKSQRRDEFLDPERNFRFETLMWGGDEILFVMPGWLALEFAEGFERWTQGWTSSLGQPITFCCGLVIAGHKTPIRQMKNVATSLADHCKTLTKDGKPIAALQVEVFEGLALPDGGLSEYRKNLYFGRRGAASEEVEAIEAQLAICGHRAIHDLVAAIAELKEQKTVPRSQIYNLLRAAAHDGTWRETAKDADGKTIRDRYDEYCRLAGEGVAPQAFKLDVLSPIEGLVYQREDGGTAAVPKPAFALSIGMIATLWDYVCPLEKEADTAHG